MMPLIRMARSVFFSVFLLGAIDLYAAEQPEPVEQKPQYIRTRELPALKISFADMQSILEKAANLLSDANVNAPKKKEFYLHETLTLGKEPDQIQIAGHSFPATARLPKAAYALSYSYDWTDAPVSKLELNLRDFSRSVAVSGTAVDQVEGISAALERNLSQHSSIGGPMLRQMGGYLAFMALLFSLGIGAAYCIVERQWRYLGIPFFALVGMIILFTLPFNDVFAGFAIYQGEPSWIVRFEPQIAFLGTITGIVLSFLVPIWRDAVRKREASGEPGTAPHTTENAGPPG